MQVIKDMIGWGTGLWLVGYVLGIGLFMIVPKDMIGWVIMPVGILMTLWVLAKKIKSSEFKYFLKLAIAWTLIAIVGDFLFITLLFKSGASYYKPDVIMYYVLTFMLPVVWGWKKRK